MTCCLERDLRFRATLSTARGRWQKLYKGLAFSAIVIGASAHAALAATQTAAMVCNSCVSVPDLQTAATTFFRTGVGRNALPGSIVYTISLNKPISMFFYKDCPNGATGTCSAIISPAFAGTVTQENSNAGALDSRTFARAVKIPALNVPNTYTDVDENIAQYIQTQIESVGTPKIDLWHGLTNFPQVVSMQVIDAQTGQTHTLYIGDTITVNYPNGYSEKWQWLGPYAGTIQWKRVPGSLMHNGQPVTSPSTSNAQPVPGSSGVSGSNTWNAPNPSMLTAYPNGAVCWGLSSVSVSDGGASSTSFGVYTYPCL